MYGGWKTLHSGNLKIKEDMAQQKIYDVLGNEIRSGAHCHIMGTSKKDPDYKVDILAMMVRGRGGANPRFIDEVTDKEYPLEMVLEHGFQIIVQGGEQQNSITDPAYKQAETPKKTNKIDKSGNTTVTAVSTELTQEMLNVLEQLRIWGFYGTLYKDIHKATFTFKINKED